MNISNRTFFYFTHVVADMCILVLSFFIGLFISDRDAISHLGLYDAGFLLFLLCGWYFTARSNRLYDDKVQENQMRELFKTINTIIWQVMLAVLFIFVIKEKEYSRTFVMVYGLSMGFLVPLSKITLKRIYLALYRHGYLRKRALVIGGGENGQLFCKYLRENKYYGYELVRYINGSLTLSQNGTRDYNNRTLLIGNSPLENINDIDEVFITEETDGHLNAREIATVLSAYAVRLRIIPSMFNMSSSGMYSFSMMGGFPLLSVRNEPLEDVYNRAAKRAFDIIFSLFVLVFVCSWLFPIIALLIKIGSPGPVFYKQERWGKRNRPFLCYKFRSMYVKAPDTNNDGKFQQAQKDDPRITPIGRFLRKSSLDEFPQFLNVLSGEMSVVGPRPHASLMNIESTHVVKNYLVRHQAKPGITGWAQVNGLRGESADPNLLKARIQHDIWYIEHWTFLLDLKIIFLTFWRMVIGDKQAY
ncbi:MULTISPECIES: exopolysaccharide biosynthesis polyprenyl glycosylphosphotransferase [Olivibacter]|uniref:Exopolysaccharide biosynthesis polyprenyl glycosylphosphotransferase n=1 Tax=Olivibacter jilunii TaxID=985016 RepID=A0ABW6B799_9SPHI